MHMQLSGVTGVGGSNEAFIFGTGGTLHFASGILSGARRGERTLSPITIPAEEAGRWRVESEFIGAIRGEERVRLTDFPTGLRYMEFTDAVNMSIKTGGSISLPLD